MVEGLVVPRGSLSPVDVRTTLPRPSMSLWVRPGDGVSVLVDSTDCGSPVGFRFWVCL